MTKINFELLFFFLNLGVIFYKHVTTFSNLELKNIQYKNSVQNLEKKLFSIKEIKKTQ